MKIFKLEDIGYEKLSDKDSLFPIKRGSRIKTVPRGAHPREGSRPGPRPFGVISARTALYYHKAIDFFKALMYNVAQSLKRKGNHAMAKDKEAKPQTKGSSKGSKKFNYSRLVDVIVGWIAVLGMALATFLYIRDSVRSDPNLAIGVASLSVLFAVNAVYKLIRK